MRASATTVAVHRIGDRAIVEVRDGGIGGADLTRRSRLRGLGDRIAALGGELVVESPPEAGTTVRASLPCVREEDDEP